MGEVLLCPRQIGLTDLPESWVNTIRTVFHSTGEVEMNAPSRVSLQQLSDHEFVIQNYNQDSTFVNLVVPENGKYIDGFTGNLISSSGKEIKLKMAPRSGLWFIKN